MVIDKKMKKKVSIIPLTLSIVIAAAWTLRWAIESRDVSLGEILAIEGNTYKTRRDYSVSFSYNNLSRNKGSSITIKPGDPAI